MDHADSEPDEAIVDKFRRADDFGTDGIDPEAIPIATLAVLWYLDENGEEAYLSKFDGHQRVSVTIGDLMSLIHEYLHHDRVGD